MLGRGVGLATMAPISQLAGERGVRVTAILSARREDLAMAADLFESVGTVIKVLDTDGTSAVENVEAILHRLIAEKKADAFFTCGSNRLMQLMKRLGREHAIPGQMAMEQIMACGLGPCYICVRTFEVERQARDAPRLRGRPGVRSAGVPRMVDMSVKIGSRDAAEPGAPGLGDVLHGARRR